MTEYEQRVATALERIATAIETIAAEPETQRAHEREQSAAVIEAIRMRQAVEGVAEEVKSSKPAEERISAARVITDDALA